MAKMPPRTHNNAETKRGLNLYAFDRKPASVTLIYSSDVQPAIWNGKFCGPQKRLPTKTFFVRSVLSMQHLHQNFPILRF